MGSAIKSAFDKGTITTSCQGKRIGRAWNLSNRNWFIVQYDILI